MAVLMMKQLCVSRIDEGYYDASIKMLITNKFDDRSILRDMMVLTKGHENPAKITQRIEMLRESNDS